MSREWLDDAAKKTGLEGFLVARPLQTFVVLNSFDIAPVLGQNLQGTNGQYFPGLAILLVNRGRGAGSWGGTLLSNGSSHSISACGADRVDAVRRTVVHELAHHVREHIGGPLREELDVAFGDAKANGRCVTTYADANHDEYFAECFAAYFYHRDALAQRDPRGYDLIEAALTRVRGLR